MQAKHKVNLLSKSPRIYIYNYYAMPQRSCGYHILSYQYLVSLWEFILTEANQACCNHPLPHTEDQQMVVHSAEGQKETLHMIAFPLLKNVIAQMWGTRTFMPLSPAQNHNVSNISITKNYTLHDILLKKKKIYIYINIVRLQVQAIYIISLVLVCWFGDPLGFNQWQLQHIFVQVFNIECNSNNCRVALDSCKQREPGVLLFNSCNHRQPTTNTVSHHNIAHNFKEEWRDTAGPLAFAHCPISFQVAMKIQTKNTAAGVEGEILQMSKYKH